MKVKRFERIESLSKFLEREEQGEISVKKVSVVSHISDVFYVFYNEDKNYDIRSKIIDFRNFLVREEKTLDDVIRSIEQERIYWQTVDSPSSKRVSDYLSWLLLTPMIRCMWCFLQYVSHRLLQVSFAH
mgnify:CR=1 FL=1